MMIFMIAIGSFVTLLALAGMTFLTVMVTLFGRVDLKMNAWIHVPISLAMWLIVGMSWYGWVTASIEYLS